MGLGDSRKTAEGIKALYAEAKQKSQRLGLDFNLLASDVHEGINAPAT